MSFAGSRAGASDLLTRTTLHLDADVSLRSIAGVISALQREPGVLLAEANAGRSCAFVAHDSAVKPEALVAAAARAGVPAHVEPAAGSPEGEGTVLTLQTARLVQLSAIALVPLVIFAAGSLLLRDQGFTRWPVFLSFVLIAIFALFRRGGK